ncbi:MAG TPA: DUF167 domain-containing protein, partial [Pyrinomonadaceae bacterium]|nr:DUF167 domain-containing protein [Pyrinomonadaceae bacterium]
MISYTEADGTLTFSVRVVPRASKSSIAGEHDGALRVRVAAPPVDGAANAELVRTLARALGVANRDVTILSGHSSRLKQVRVTGTGSEELERLFGNK